MSRPVDWQPLRGSDPTPGDPGEVAALARRYADTAAAIQDQADGLRKLAGQASGGWKGKAGTVFHDKAGDLADRILKAKNRYDQAAQALSGFVPAMTAAQQDADRALQQAQAAQAAMSANQPDPTPPVGSPPPTADQQAAAKRKATAYSDAQGQLAAAQRLVDTAESDYQNAAKRAADTIHTAIDHDGLKDSWWDRNFGWIKTVVQIIGVVVLVLSVAALIASLVVPGLNIFGGLLLADLLTYLATAGTVLMLAGHIALYASGHGSLTDIVLDVVALATFGVGKVAEKAVAAMAESGQGVGGAVAAGRAGRAFMSGEGFPGMLYSLAEHLPGGGLLKLMPGVGKALTGAESAAADASAVVTTLKVTTPALTMTGLSGGDIGLARSMTLLNQVDAKVPNVFRIGVLRSAGTALSGTVGLANYGNLGAGAYSTYQGYVADPAQEAGVDQSVSLISQHYSNPVIPVP